jgi:hypothetical protein
MEVMIWSPINSSGTNGVELKELKSILREENGHGENIFR